mmetsp:Transcript_56927/g.151999  ORF Transcript_56927/g.151999 Transcript_56927/m.151999 type:complete len:207 (-) Transcript_56927:37-657(-)
MGRTWAAMTGLAGTTNRRRDRASRAARAADSTARVASMAKGDLTGKGAALTVRAAGLTAAVAVRSKCREAEPPTTMDEAALTQAVEGVLLMGRSHQEAASISSGARADRGRLGARRRQRLGTSPGRSGTSPRRRRRRRCDPLGTGRPGSPAVGTLLPPTGPRILGAEVSMIGLPRKGPRRGTDSSGLLVPRHEATRSLEQSLPWVQ